MRGWQRAFLGALLVGAVAVAGIALNFTLLRLTQDAHDPVGKLSPRAVFMTTTRSPGETTPAATTEDGPKTTVPATTTPGDPDGDGDRDD